MLTEPEAGRLLNVDPVALKVMRHRKGNAAVGAQKTPLGIRYDPERAIAARRQRRAAAPLEEHLTMLEKTAHQLLAHGRAEPLADPVMEQSASEASALIAGERPAVFAARIFAASDACVRAIARANPGMTEREAKKIAAEFARRIGFLANEMQQVRRRMAELKAGADERRSNGE
jgi:hypothetical protein